MGGDALASPKQSWLGAKGGKLRNQFAASTPRKTKRGTVQEQENKNLSENYEEMHETDENGVRYIKLEPTPLALAQWIAMTAIDGEHRENRRNALIMLVAHMRNNPEVHVNDAIR
jgi:hypothetical protein